MTFLPQSSDWTFETDHLVRRSFIGTNEVSEVLQETWLNFQRLQLMRVNINFTANEHSFVVVSNCPSCNYIMEGPLTKFFIKLFLKPEKIMMKLILTHKSLLCTTLNSKAVTHVRTHAQFKMCKYLKIQSWLVGCQSIANITKLFRS